MEFLGIHELSVEFDIPARVLRYKFLQLILSGKLVEGQDYRRDDFVDDQHFVWKINPVSFMRESGYQLVNKSGSHSEVIATKPGNKVADPVTKTVTEPAPIVNHEPGFDNHSGSQVGDKMDAKRELPAMPSLEREMIDLLKGQIVVKDHQIHELTEHSKKTDDLNVKLIGTTVQQAEQIRSLLRLTGGKTQPGEVVTKERETAAKSDDQTDQMETDFDDKAVNRFANNSQTDERQIKSEP